MAKSRKDKKGRTLRKGETVRKADGLYQYSYTDINGKRQYIYSSDLLILRQMEEEILRSKLDGIDSFNARNLSLNDIFDKYMDTRKDLAPRTVAGYLYQYNAYVRKSLGKRRISDLKYSDILEFYINLMDEKNLSYGTIEHLQRELHPAFDMAVRDGLIRVNPTRNVLGQLKKQTGATLGVRNALTPEETKLFLSFMDGHPVYDHWKPLYTIFVGTGLRVGELTALRWDDIDFDNNVIVVDHALCYFAGKLNKTKKRWYVTTPKTEAGIRTVPMISEVKEAFQKVKEYQEQQDINCESEIDGYTDFVFLNRFGRVFNQTDLDRNLKRIIESCNDNEISRKKSKEETLLLPQFTCHCLRHTFCARFCENETNIKVIQSVMGHKDIKTTMDVYAEVSEAKKKESMNALSMKLDLF